MELTNEFTVSAPIGQAWSLLTDIERVAPCVPGFKLTGAREGVYEGAMKVKVGAVQTTYDCSIRFEELDEESHRAVISAQGRETRGQGGVTATITSTLVPEGEATRAYLVTSLNVTGRVAQFGRGILADVSERLVEQFLSRLESMIDGGQAEAAGGDRAGGIGAITSDGVQSAGPAASPVSGAGEGAAGAGQKRSALLERGADEGSDALNLVSLAGAPILKRIAPFATIAALLGILWAILRRSR